ncbi:MAG: hypothetical protein JWO61_327 [Candidatus Saccharibacteria bacterium]|nr:hypothetical protein [Candidatus Saccharibacteria bacterium]
MRKIASVYHRDLFLLYAFLVYATQNTKPGYTSTHMHTVRSIFVWLLRFVCVLAISGTVYLVTLSTTLLDRNDVKQWMSTSGLYSDNMLISTLYPAETIENQVSGLVISDQNLIPTTAIQHALQRTFPDAFIGTSFETVINNSYDWLEGKRATFNFSIPVDSKRDVFIRELAKEIEPQVATLPICGVLSQTLCRPAFLSPSEFTEQAITSTMGGSDFLKAPITEAVFTSAPQTKETAILSELPHLRWLVSLLLYLLPIIALFSALIGGLLTLRGTRLKFFIKLSRGVFSTMVLAVVIAGSVLILDNTHNLYIEQLLGNSNPLAPLMAHFLTNMIVGIAWTLLLWAGLALLLATISWIMLSLLAKRRPVSQPPTAFSNIPYHEQ